MTSTPSPRAPSSTPTLLHSTSSSPPPKPPSPSPSHFVRTSLVPLESRLDPWRRPFLQTTAGEILLVIAAVSGQLITQAQVSNTIFPVASIAMALGEERKSHWAWLPASYSLTTGIFVLPMGRLGDIYGHKFLILIGWFINLIANIITGFMPSAIPFDIMRAIAGIGSSCLLPNCIAILGRAFPPGPLRTFSFALFGALAPSGALVGAVMTSLLIVETDWRWAFWVTAFYCALMLIFSFFILPVDETDRTTKVDWIGAGLGLVSMILFNFVFNQAPIVGWDTVYIYVLLIVSVLLIGVFVFWEVRAGEDALVPAHMFRKPEVPLVCVALWFGWMSFGIFLYYTSSYIRDIKNVPNPLLISAHMTALGPVGVLAALMLVFVMPRLGGQWIFAIAMLAFFAGNLIMSLAPPNVTFWAMIFPATVIVVFGPDFSFAAGQLIVSNSVSREFQGAAGGLVTTIVNYSISIGLGLAGAVERYVGHEGQDVLAGYRGAFRFGFAIAATAFVLVVLFVRTPKQDQKGEGGEDVEKGKEHLQDEGDSEYRERQKAEG